MKPAEQLQVLRYIPEAIRFERLSRDWTQEDLAQAVGSSNSQISMIETGKKLPKLETLDRMLVAWNLSFADFSRRCMKIAELRDPAPPGPRGGPFETPASPAFLDLLHRIGRGSFETEDHVVLVIPKTSLGESRESEDSGASQP